ncbi:helicase associated domain-containing protein, partial [Pelagophyceae sp. CCMP2097]
WDARYPQLEAYHAAHGDCAVPFNFAEADGTKLGRWVGTQRQAYKVGEMSPVRFERLEAVAFVWDVLADGWDAHLTAYHVAHGDSAVPRSFPATDGTKLGRWVGTQRQAYKVGEMSPERAQRLEEAGFAW